MKKIDVERVVVDIYRDLQLDDAIYFQESIFGWLVLYLLQVLKIILFEGK